MRCSMHIKDTTAFEMKKKSNDVEAREHFGAMNPCNKM